MAAFLGRGFFTARHLWLWRRKAVEGAPAAVLFSLIAQGTDKGFVLIE